MFGHFCERDTPSKVTPYLREKSVEGIDVKNINLQIKNIKKTCFFTFIKNIKNMDKNIKLHYRLK